MSRKILGQCDCSDGFTEQTTWPDRQYRLPMSVAMAGSMWWHRCSACGKRGRAWVINRVHPVAAGDALRALEGEEGAS